MKFVRDVLSSCYHLLDPLLGGGQGGRGGDCLNNSQVAKGSLDTTCQIVAPFDFQLLSSSSTEAEAPVRLMLGT